MEIDTKQKDISYLKYKFNSYMNILQDILGEYAKSKKFFSSEDISKEFSNIYNEKHNNEKHHPNKKSYVFNNLIDTFLSSLLFYQDINKKKTNFYRGFIKQNPLHHYKYSLYNSNYSDFFGWINTKFDEIFKHEHFDENTKKYKFYVNKNKKTTNLEEIFIVLGILETMELTLYECIGGDTPQVYIYLSSRYQLQKIIDSPNSYKNQILENVAYRHKISSKMLTHLFKEEVSTERFWNEIEDYFLGRIPENILKD